MNTAAVILVGAGVLIGCGLCIVLVAATFVYWIHQ